MRLIDPGRGYESSSRKTTIGARADSIARDFAQLPRLQSDAIRRAFGNAVRTLSAVPSVDALSTTMISIDDADSPHSLTRRNVFASTLRLL